MADLNEAQAFLDGPQESVAANDSKRAQLAIGHRHNVAVFADLKTASEETSV